MELNGETELLRVKALRDYGILDSAPESAFDDAVLLASRLCQTPISLITLVDADRQWIKARVGLDVCETPRRGALCSAAIQQRSPLVIPDTHADPRFASSAMVTGGPRVRFYAGVPLINPDGFAVGTLCVVDRTPRQLFPEQLDCLTRLAGQVMRLMESRRALVQLSNSQRQLKLLEACVGQLNDIVMIAEACPGSELPRILYVNDAFERRLGYKRAEVIGQSPRMLHSSQSDPDEVERLHAAVRAGRPVRVELRNRTKAGRHIWIELDLAPVKNDEGEVTHWISVHRDIQRRKATEAALKQASRLLAETEALARVGGWEWDLLSQDVFWTHETYRIFGVSPLEYKPSIDSVLHFYSPRSQTILRGAIEEAAASGRCFDLELDCILPGNRQIWVHVTSKVLWEK